MYLDSMWITVIAVCGFKLLWMLFFVIACLSTFLMVMYNRDKEGLKKRILCDDWSLKKPSTLNDSQVQMKNLNETDMPDDVNYACVRDQYKSLLGDLKRDLWKTEDEVKALQNEVENLSKRRKELKNELSNASFRRQKKNLKSNFL